MSADGGAVTVGAGGAVPGCVGLGGGGGGDGGAGRGGAVSARRGTVGLASSIRLKSMEDQIKSKSLSYDVIVQVCLGVVHKIYI